MTLIDKSFLAKLDRLDILSRKIHQGREKGERRSRKRGESVEFADYRHYVQGDEPRFIDWNIYGRLDRLFLKLFLEEEELNVTILLDTSASMAFGRPVSKLLLGQKIAAALGYIALSNHNRITAIPFDTGPLQGFGPTRGRRMVWSFFNFLQGLESGGETSLAEACRLTALQSRRKGVLVLISDFLDPDGFETGLRYFVSKNLDLHVIQILSPEEVEPTLRGDLRLVDTERGAVTEVTVSENLLRTYRRTLTSFLGHVKSFCTARGASYLFTRTDVSFEKTVLKVMRRGGLLG